MSCRKRNNLESVPERWGRSRIWFSLCFLKHKHCRRHTGNYVTANKFVSLLDVDSNCNDAPDYATFLLLRLASSWMIHFDSTPTGVLFWRSGRFSKRGSFLDWGRQNTELSCRRHDEARQAQEVGGGGVLRVDPLVLDTSAVSPKFFVLSVAVEVLLFCWRFYGARTMHGVA